MNTATNTRRQIAELVARIQDSRVAGNGNRPELQERIVALRAELATTCGDNEVPSLYLHHSECNATGIYPSNPIVKHPTYWTTRCPDCARVVRVHMPRVNIETRIAPHAGKH